MIPADETVRVHGVSTAGNAHVIQDIPVFVRLKLVVLHHPFRVGDLIDGFLPARFPNDTVQGLNRNGGNGIGLHVLFPGKILQKAEGEHCAGVYLVLIAHVKARIVPAVSHGKGHLIGRQGKGLFMSFVIRRGDHGLGKGDRQGSLWLREAELGQIHLIRIPDPPGKANIVQLGKQIVHRPFGEGIRDGLYHLPALGGPDGVKLRISCHRNPVHQFAVDLRPLHRVKVFRSPADGVPHVLGDGIEDVLPGDHRVIPRVFNGHERPHKEGNLRPVHIAEDGASLRRVQPVRRKRDGGLLRQLHDEFVRRQALRKAEQAF